MGRAFEYRKAAKLKRWGHMAKTFTRLGKQIAIAVKAGGPEPENNPTLRSVIALWMEYAKSMGVEPLGRFLTSPDGVKQ